MALSDDLRKRVVEAVVWRACRAMRRPSVSGSASPAPCAGSSDSDDGRDFAEASGGDRRSGRIEAHRDYLMGLIRRTPDITLLEIQERLIANCGERFSSSVIWRFFDRHEITFKKKRRMPRSSSARTS